MMIMYRTLLLNKFNVSSGLPYIEPVDLWPWFQPPGPGLPGGSVIEVPLIPAGYLRTTETGIQDTVTMELVFRADHTLGPQVGQMQFIYLWRNRTSIMYKDTVVALSSWPTLTNVQDLALATNPFPSFAQQLLQSASG
jgi:hypothetical protein